MHIEINYKDGTSKGTNPSEYFEPGEGNFQGMLKDENKVRPIKSFNLTNDSGKTIMSGVFTLVGAILIDQGDNISKERKYNGR